MVVGSCSADEEKRVSLYRDLISTALAGFRGEVICGGTTSGVSGIVGSLPKLLSKQDRTRFKTYGYLPKLDIDDPHPDREGYNVLFSTHGNGFSPLEPLQMWRDLFASGLQPSQIKVIGFGGGKIAAIEYRLALALGASVGVLTDSRRAVEELLNDSRWQHHRNLVGLLPDPMTLRALFLSPSSDIGEAALLKAARASHNKAIQNKRHEIVDPAMQTWKKLPPEFKLSSIEQKRYAEAILRYEGYGLREKDKNKIELIVFPKEKIEKMAEMEHGRWNLERTRSGWKRGEVRDPDKKITPYLLAWSELPDDVKKWDLDYVERWPQDFKEAGIEIYKLEHDKREK